MQPPIILFLSSTSFHFPLDLHGILANEGAETKRYESIDDFLSTPDRHTPYVAVLEIGSTEDVDRALLAYEWCEQIQPIAPCRTILLMASKNIQLGDRAARFGNAEVAHLPLPLKNLLFKVDLQKRLLLADEAQAAAERGKKAPAENGFSTEFVERPPKLDRVLLIRGPGPKQGYWQEAGESPSGKVRWRWVSTQKPEAQSPAEKAGVTWAADSKAKPIYEEATGSWAVADPEADLLGFRKEKAIFSARTSHRLPPVERVGETKREFGAGQQAIETGRAFAQEAKAAVTAVVTEAKPSCAAPASETIQRPQEKGTKAGEKFSPPATPADSTRKLQAGTAPADSPPQKFQPGEATPAPSATQTRSGADAPGWQKHASPATTAARPPASRAQAPAETAAPSEKAPRPAEAEAGTPASAAEEDPIPEHTQEEEPADNSGYSVPVSSEAERQTGEIRRPSAEETYSARAPEHPRKEAEYSATPDARAKPAGTEEESITELKARRRAEAEAAAALKARRTAEQEAAAKAMARPEEVVAAALEKIAEQRKQFLQAAPAAPAKSEPAGAPQPPPASVAPPAETHLSPAEPAYAGEVTRAGPRTAPAKEETKIKGDPAAGQIETEVALEGTPERQDEAIRIRARAEGDSSHRERPEKAPPENPLKYRHFVTMTLEELSDRDSSWHPMHRYRIYLSANHRYYGVKDPAALLPLWVYEGELAPEFLEDKKAWKFYDRYPELYSTLDTLPPVVLEQIYVMAGKAPPGASGGAATQMAPGVTEGMVAASAAAAAPAEREPERGLWGSVKSFFKKLFSPSSPR